MHTVISDRSLFSLYGSIAPKITDRAESQFMLLYQKR